MLYDPKWEVKADPLSLESLIAWLEKQPAEQEYCYYDNGYCLLARYFSAVGFKDVEVYGWYWRHSDATKDIPLSDAFKMIAVQGKWTFGAALKRARKALASC